jgi:hypothetical protein
MDKTLLAANAQPADASQKLLDAVRPSVFKIEAGSASGTGWLVDENTIVTSYHVVEGQRHITAVGQDGKRHPLGAKVVFDRKNDVAILTFAGPVPKLGEPLQRADTSKIEPQSPLAHVGHPWGGAATPYFGTYDRHADYKEWLTLETKFNPSAFRRRQYEDKLRMTKPDELSIPFLVARMNVEHGCSGGPIINSENKVVSIVTQNTSEGEEFEFMTPVEAVNAVVAARQDPTKFEHREGYREIGALTYLKTASHDPFTFAVRNIGIAGGTILSSSLYGYSTDFMCLTTKNQALWKGGVGAAVLGCVTYNDATGLLRSSNSLDSWKYGLALASDATVASGFAARYMSVLRGTGLDKAGRVGKALMLGGAAARLACEFIPNNYVVDIGNEGTLNK